MPMARVAGCSTRAGRLRIGPAARPLTNPSAATVETAASHNTMLMVDPAAAIDQPRSTSIEGPKLKIIANPTLKRPQIKPAAITAIAALRSSRTEVVVVVTEFAEG